MWIDIEQQRPPMNERVIILIPFGMRVRDDTWSEHGFLNTNEYVSHWQAIKPPGTYKEIMERPQGEPLPIPLYDEKEKEKLAKQQNDEIFSAAVLEHYDLMNSLTLTQFKLRFEQENRHVVPIIEGKKSKGGQNPPIPTTLPPAPPQGSGGKI